MSFPVKRISRQIDKRHERKRSKNHVIRIAEAHYRIMNIRMRNVRQKILPSFRKKIFAGKSLKDTHKKNYGHDPGNQHHHFIKGSLRAYKPKQNDDQEKTVNISDQLFDSCQFFLRPKHRQTTEKKHESKKQQYPDQNRRICAILLIIYQYKKHDKRKADPERIQRSDSRNFDTR